MVLMVLPTLTPSERRTFPRWTKNQTKRGPILTGPRFENALFLFSMGY
ncbi:MAG: hypothetical protein JWN81_1962 [Solirubrobacterales bacterium]|nr:hypothetical protein [Solirubrobacterales bacterium]